MGASQVAADALDHAARAAEFIGGLGDFVPSQELEGLVEALQAAKTEQTDTLDKLRAIAARVQTIS